MTPSYCCPMYQMSPLRLVIVHEALAAPAVTFQALAGGPETSPGLNLFSFRSSAIHPSRTSP